MPTLKELIEKKNHRLETVPDRFISAVEKAQRESFNKLISLLDKLKRNSEGKIELTASNLSKIETIGNELQKNLFDKEYGEAVIEFAKEFDTQAIINKTYFKEAFGDFKDKEIFKTILKNAQKRAITDLADTAIDSNFINPLKEILNASVTNGQNFSDAVKTLRTYIEGNSEVDGTLLRYVKQVAVDGFSISDREYTKAIAEDLEIEWYLYSGGLIKDSREFCEERNGKYFHKKEVEAWAEIDSWKGKIPNTNDSTIFSFAGGYNCRHSIMPVGISVVPQDVIDRNIANGNYEKEN